MTVESIIGISSGLIAICGAIFSLYKRYKKKSLTELMAQLTNKKQTTEEHRKVLKKMNRLLGFRIKKEYIQNFVLSNKGKENVFFDICKENNIEPTEEICRKLLGYDSPSKRAEYEKSKQINNNIKNTQNQSEINKTTYVNNEETVYMSELLQTKNPKTCEKLISILEKHNVKYSFIKGTKDIWCRDYMPVQTESGKLIQFKYDPSYLKDNKEWGELRSNTNEILEKNDWLQKYNIEHSDIILDGGNVLICKGRAIISDRLFTENPELNKELLKEELSKLLECEIIIIPALKSQYEDMTGHADGMVRFVNRNTIIGNERRANEYKYMKERLQEAIDTFALTYIDIPYFEDKDTKNPESAIGIYVNYLELSSLIIFPIFDRKEDKQAIEIIQKAFPNKIIETINYDEIAKQGGLLNCTTWVIK